MCKTQLKSLAQPGGLIAALLMAFLFAVEAAEPAARVMRLSSNALVREQQLHAVDADDGYLTPQGRRKLYRLAGALAVRVDNPAVLDRLTATGGPLEGYVKDGARNGGEVLILQAPTEERANHQANPAQIQQRIRAARGAAGVRDAGPVFIDPPSGLYLLPNEEILVRLQPGVDAQAYFANEWPNVRAFLGSKDQFVVRQPGRTAEEILHECDRHMGNAAVHWAEPNFVVQTVASAWPNDKYFPRQWHLFHNGQLAGFGASFTGLTNADINVSNAWNLTTGSTNIIVAIMDDGVQLNHPDLAPNLATNRSEIPGNGLDDDGNGYVDDVVGGRFEAMGFAPNANPFASTNNHGTSVAGLAVARGSNTVGVAGVAFTSRLLPITVVGLPITFERQAEAFYYAGGINAAGVPIWRGADVLNLSFAGSESEIVSTAIHLVSTKGRGGLGCLIFAAAGNDSTVWQSVEFANIANGAHTLRVEFVRNASGGAGQNAVWLGDVAFPGSRYEHFDGPGLPPTWTTSPGSPWFVDTSPGATFGAVKGALRSGPLGDNQTNFVQCLWTNTAFLTGRGHVLYRTSTEAGDQIRIYNDATLLASGSGQPDENLGIHFPARHPDVISVGATTDYNLRAGYSQFGTNLVLSAPGGGGGRNYIFTTDRTGTDGYQTSTADFVYQNPDCFERFSGTSAATPVAAGVGALVLSANTNLNPTDVRIILTSTAAKIGNEPYVNGRNNYFGYGKVDASAAVLAAQDYWFLPPDTKFGHILGRVVNLPLVSPSIGTNQGGTFLEILQGGVLTNASGTIGLNGLASGNRVVVSGAGSRWVNTNLLTVGGRGSANQLIVTNGGMVASAAAVLGALTLPSSDNNLAVVAGPGSLWTNTLNLTVGGAGAGNQLLVTNGGTVVASNIIVGAQLSSINNRVIVDGGTLRGALDIRRGTNVLNSGLVEAATLRLPSSAGFFEFKGGSLSSGGSTVTTGNPFIVGNGTVPALFTLTGNSLHAFNAGLTLRPNATLNGNGTISGILTVQSGATVAPGTSVGVLVLSNPPALQGMLVMELSTNGSAWTNDQIQVRGTLTCGGTLVVKNLGPALAAGNRFTLFSASGYAGAFSSVTLPPLTGGLIWTNKLLLDGSIEAIVPPTQPLVATVPATSITPLSATLNGTVNPGNAATRFWFEWGTSASLTNVTASSELAASAATFPVSNTLSGLIPGRTYRFRLAASNAVGISRGPVLSFALPAFGSLAWYRLGENDPGASNGAVATFTTNVLGGGLGLYTNATYTTNVSANAASRIGSAKGLRFTTGNYGTNAIVTTLTDNFGIELWVKPDDLSGYKCLAYNGDTAGSGWGLYQFAGSYGALFGGVTFIGSSPATPSVWTHLALVRDNGLTTFYANGVPSGAAPDAPNVPTGRFGVGSPPQGSNTEFFNGALDEVRVFAFAAGAFNTTNLLLVPPRIAPTLQIVQSGPGIIISWSPADPGWVLQESPTLAPTAWTNAPSGMSNSITLPITTPKKFYRLTSQ